MDLWKNYSIQKPGGDNTENDEKQPFDEYMREYKATNKIAGLGLLSDAIIIFILVWLAVLMTLVLLRE